MWKTLKTWGLTARDRAAAAWTRLTATEAWQLLTGTVEEFAGDKAMRLAAALAYYAIFSIAPILIIAVGVAGLLMGQESVRTEVMAQLEATAGPRAADLVASMMQARLQASAGLRTTIIGILVLLFAATGVFAQLKDALNTVWEVEVATSDRKVKRFARQRLLAFLMIVAIGFLMLATLVLTTVVEVFMEPIIDALPFSGYIWWAINHGFNIAVTMPLFALSFIILPDAEVRFKDVWIGALVTAVLFVAGKYILAIYLAREGLASAYGAAGSFVVFLMWIYYSSVIFLLGAEFTQVYARRHGRHIRPREGARQLPTQDRG